MTEIFDEELREQLARARQALRDARSAGDEDGEQAYAGRVSELLRIAERHGIDVPRSAAEPW
ncbi:hypothetical protein AB0K51_17060 [Kitasatospora sp. NPDC049285]|uniref:hypothetical protein n=1 Tax=Kitasatospora sp. NPDC049285 TaxID=3157096 RepID=UPI00341F99EC